MAKPIKPRWCARDKVWLVPGAISEVTGRRKYVILRDEDGQKIEWHDHVGKIKATLRLQERKVSGPLVRDVIQLYLEWHDHRGSKATTIREHEFHLLAFGRFEHQGVRYDDRPASSIMLRDLARVRESMESRGCQSGYVRHLYNSVLACWHWAARPIEGRDPERLLASNPLEGAERPRIGRSKILVVPWPTIEALLKFAEGRVYDMTNPAVMKFAWRKALMLRLIAESGCRPLEACNLEWAWVNEVNRVIVIPAAQHKTGWRHGTDRIFGLTEPTASSLLETRDLNCNHPRWVFAIKGQNHAPSRGRLDHWFATLRTRAIEEGIPIPPTMTLYSLRHSLVTQARQGGVSYQDLAAHMGHSEQVAETIYSHLDPNFVRTQFDRMHAARTKS